MKKYISVLIITRNRSKELFQTIQNIRDQTYSNLEIIIVENGSNEDVVTYNKKNIQKYGPIRYYTLENNTGVSGGRNVALAYAKGDYVIELDDDAVFECDNSIDKIVSIFEKSSGIGILAFKITNYYSKKMIPQEYPFRNKKRDPELSGTCTWFIGAGHAFSRRMIEEVGLYRDFYPWGEEEQDISLRAIDKGFEIYYYPVVNILHKRTPTARVNTQHGFGPIHLKNRVKVALLNLPWICVMSYFIVRSIQFSVFLYKDLRIPLNAIKLIKSEWPYIKSNRKVLKIYTLIKLLKLRGQLFF